MKQILLVFCLLVMVSAVTAQTPSMYVPTVSINNSSVSFQRSLYPEHYRETSAAADMRWVNQNDSALVAFWDSTGTEILQTLTRLSGIDWVEPQIEVYLIRYFPSMGGADPLVIAMGGMRNGELIVAAPTGNQLKLNFIYQLSQRMLAQAEKSDDPFMRSLAGHPLMRPGVFRRDNLALLLALVTAQQVIGLDSTYAAYQSAFWKARTPGRQVLEEYMLSDWILSPDHTLAQWVIEEPNSSRLVAATRPPRKPRAVTASGPREYIEGLPPKGELGFSVKWNAASRLEVDRIDMNRLAFASGLREGDEIRSVDGVRVRNQRDMVKKILAGLDQGGASMTILRDGEPETIVLEPMGMLFDDELFWNDEDSLYYQDSTGGYPAPPTDSTKPIDTAGATKSLYGP